MHKITCNNDTIKNVYATKEDALEEVLNEVKKENKIIDSIVTNLYEKLYKKVGFKINKTDSLKNFLVISA